MSDNENVDPYNDDRWSIFKDDYLPFTNDPDLRISGTFKIYTATNYSHFCVRFGQPNSRLTPTVYQPQVFEIM